MLNLLLIIFILLINPPEYDTAAFGDSITVGGKAALADVSFIKLLEVDSEVIDNQAVNGSKIIDQVAAIEAYSGPAVTYLWTPGMNDMRLGTDLVEYEAELRHGLDIAMSRGIKVYLGACLPMAAEGYFQYGGSPERVEEFNKIAERIATEYENVTFIPFSDYDPVLHIKPDLLHPNETGHWVIYEAFISAMKRKTYLPLIITE